MITEKTKDAIKEATTVIPREESNNSPSDAQIVYAPLLKYGAIAIVMVAIIVTTAILTDRQIEGFNGPTAQATTNNEVLAQVATQPETINNQVSEVVAMNEQVEVKVNAENETTLTQAAESTIAIIEHADADEVSAKEMAAEQERVVVVAETKTPQITPVASTVSAAPGSLSTTAIAMAHHRDLMQKQDEKQLELVKINHERHIAILRNQFGQQNSYMEKNIKQIESHYLKQVAALKRSQQLRQSMTNRI